MRTRFLFFLFVALGAVLISPLVGGMATAAGALAGMDPASLLILFGTATGGVFAAVMALASLGVSLFVSADEPAGKD
ncbi:hypothetical protein [Micromonospora taraxaci]|uniref:hypothetical protein n=1 Tax=Micromonospora taraxaci TaxID=1316803 RepID=UPI0033AA9A37